MNSPVTTTRPLLRSYLRAVTMAVAAACSLGACLQPAGSPATQLERVSIYASQPSAALGMELSLGATGYYSDGTQQDVSSYVAWQSSDDSILELDHKDPQVGRARHRGVAVVTASLGAVVGELPVEITEPVLLGLHLDVKQPQLALGTSMKLSAAGVYSNQQQTNLTSLATWTVSDPTVAEIVNGRLVAKNPGEVVLRARYAGQEAAVQLRTADTQLQTLRISAPDLVVPVGGKVAMRAYGIFADHSTQELTDQVAWESSQPATMAQDQQSLGTGMLAALAIGSTQVRAKLQAVTSEPLPMHITGAQLQKLELVVAQKVLPVWQQARVRAIGVYSDGTHRDVSHEVNWEAPSPEHGRIVVRPGDGTFVRAEGTGEAPIQGRLGSISAATQVQVTAGWLSSLLLPAEERSLPLGARQSLSATGVFSDGTHADVSHSVQWQVSDRKVVALCGASPGHFQAAGEGQTAVQARWGGHEARTSVRVENAQPISLEITPAQLLLGVNTAQQLSATAIYTNRQVVGVGADVLWRSSDPAVASVESGGILPGFLVARGPGNATITATLAGMTTQISIVVTDATLLSLAVAPDIQQLPAGTQLSLKASGKFSDGRTQDLTDSVLWVSSADNLVSVSNEQASKGRCLGRGLGVAVVTAKLGTQISAASLTVTDAAITGLQLTQVSPVLAKGTQQSYIATATYSDGTMRDVTTDTQWSVSDPTLAAIENAPQMAGVLLALREGSVLVRAAFAGKNAETTLTITTAALQSVAISTPTSSVPVGTTVQLTATATFSDGSTADVTSQAIWSVGVMDLASISNGAGSRGLLTGLKQGSATVVAVFQGNIAYLNLYVTEPTVLVLNITPDGHSMAPRTTHLYRALALYSNGLSRDVTEQAAWTTSDSSVAIVSDALGSKGLLTALVMGTAEVSADLGHLHAAVNLTVK